MTARSDEINEAVTAEMKLRGVEDTTENRILFLKGLQDGWKEDEDSSIEKLMYQLALNSEIFRLELSQVFPPLMEK